ncbi:MAG: hypothetical protein WCC01_13725 [Acidimicrobiia bacterium]
MMIEGMQHVQLAMPPGREDGATTFYKGLLGPRRRRISKLAAVAGLSPIPLACT